MLELFFTMLAIGLSSAPSDDQKAAVQGGQNTISQAPSAEASGIPPSQSAAPTFNMAVVPQGLTADPQQADGTYTSAAEVKPILTATRANWVVLREYEGKDWLYVTHLWSWRCGLKAIAIALNDEPMQNWPLPKCHTETAAPNALLPDDGLPVLTLR